MGALWVCFLASDREGDRPVNVANREGKTMPPEQDGQVADRGGTAESSQDASLRMPGPQDARIASAKTQTRDAGYYREVIGLEGDALRIGLHRLIRRHRVLTYGELWDALADLDRGSDGKVTLIYSRVLRAAARHGGNHGMWNREHLWPRAYGISRSSPANTDLHHIRASDVKINADRGHLYFDETEGDTSPGNTFSADADSWEPPREVKGDIARAMFYMAVRYEGGEPNESDLELAEVSEISKRQLGKLSTLLEWHRLDPVSAEEKTRNQKIYRNYQGNRNPFIDHPEWAARVFSSK